MEYLEDNLEEWLGAELQAYGDDDYLLFVSKRGRQWGEAGGWA